MVDPKREGDYAGNRSAGRRVGLLAGLLFGAALSLAPLSAGADGLTIASRARVPIRAGTLAIPGEIEHRALSLHGIPVRGGYQRALIGADGSERILIDRRPVAPPALLPSQARVAAADVSAIARAHLAARADPIQGTGADDPQAGDGADPPGREPDPPQLVYRLILGEPVLAWEVQMPLTMSPEPSRPRLWISAATGRVLEEQEQVLSSRARVFEENPSRTPEPIEVELDIDVDVAGVPLDGPVVRALNCVDEPPADPEAIFAWTDEEECYAVVGLLSDEDGNYFPRLPDILYPEQSQDTDDEYAQLSMYFHSQRFFTRFAELGMDSFSCEKSTMLANFHEFGPSGSLEFTPLNNAFYTNECDLEDGPTMIFGQGSEVDFGYDGDVVYHELGHGVVAHLAPDGLLQPRLRAEASLVDARALNEALADYFSVVLTDDPLLGDYVGRFWANNSKPAIRDAENGRTCPTDMRGQEHNDSEPFMAALWATRKRVGGDVLDPLVLEMTTRVATDTSLEEAAAVLLEIAEDAYAMGTLDVDGLDTLVRAFGSRGVFDCPRVITDQRRVETGQTMYLRRLTDAAQPFYPGPLQLSYEVPPGVDRAFVRFKLVAQGSSNPVYAHVLVRRADTPITFEYRLVATDEEVEIPEDGSEPEDPDPVREVILTTGDWDEELQPYEYAPNEYEAELTGLVEGEVLHLALANVATNTAVASSVRVQTATVRPDEDDEEEGETESPEPEPNGVDVDDAERTVVGGCTCTSGARCRPAQGGLVGALMLLALGLRRRRPRLLESRQ